MLRETEVYEVKLQQIAAKKSDVREGGDILANSPVQSIFVAIWFIHHFCGVRDL